ncbi:MAG TPA: hypothetical protein VFO28_12085 [Burkholderiaceae bacterium]|nr:hypothetical protein [Burkholderiaceae bacterium]
MITNHWALAAATAGIVALSGCTYYVPAPSTTVVPGAPASFDRSFDAAAGAMRDQGLTISAEDRNAGRVVGKLGNGTVTAQVRQQADGSVRVQFDATGMQDPAVIDRVSRGYDRRMGR